MIQKRSLCIGILLVAVAAVIGGSIAFALFDEESDATHIKDDEIENSTLIIGTHLIHISALSDPLYELATDTASASGQSGIYYKSELADGRWFEISSASGISDIMSEGKAVDAEVIEQLYVRYHTKSDGITYDLLTGKAVCIFDIIDPYDLDALPELDSIVVHHKLLQQKESKSGTDKRNMKLIEEALNRDLKEELGNEQTDSQISSLQDYYEDGKREGKETADTALSLMESLDATRRLKVYRKLYDDTLPELMSAVQQNTDDIEGFYTDYDLISAIGTAMEEVEKKLIQYEAEEISEGSTTTEKVKNDLINQVTGAGTEDLDNLLEDIEALLNIEKGQTKNPKKEAELISEVLIPEALESLQEGETQAGAGTVWEMESLARTALASMSGSKKDAFIDGLLSTLADLEGGGATGNREIAAAVKDLRDTLQELRLESDADNSALAELFATKEQLQKDRQSFLDDNNLAGAEKVAKEIEEFDRKISEEENRLTDILTSDTAGATDKARAQAALKTGLISAAIVEAKENIQKLLEDGSYEDALAGLDSMEALTDINPKLALACMQELYRDVLEKQYLEDDRDKGLQNIKEKLLDIIAESEELIETGLSEDVIWDILEIFFGTDFEHCSDEEKVIFAAALYRYVEEQGGKEIQEQAANIVLRLYAEDNRYIYKRLPNEEKEFISLYTFSLCSDYRYIFYNSSKSVTLSLGNTYATYGAYSNRVRTDGREEEMDTYARYSEDLYLSETYMQEQYHVTCIRAEGTDYGILITESMEERIAELLEALYYAD